MGEHIVPLVKTLKVRRNFKLGQPVCLGWSGH
jgi:hypothetical protein